MTRLRLQSVPLHTEEPRWAAQAPAQVEAACKRGGHAIGLTETRGPTIDECKRIATRAGYVWFQAPMDAHRNTSVLVRKDLKVLHHDAVEVFNNYRTSVTFEWQGRHVTVYEMHWEMTPKGHQVQTDSLVHAMDATSQNHNLSFYMGDSNPRPQPQSKHDSEPARRLRLAGCPTIWDELKRYPPGLGVNVIGRNTADPRVKPVSAVLHLALGSDHRPATAAYEVRRAPR